MQKTPIILSLAIADLYFSYVLFDGQQYFSLLASLALFALFALFAGLFIFCRIYTDEAKKTRALSLVMYGLIALSILLLTYTYVFVSSSSFHYAYLAVKTCLVFAAALISVSGIYLIGKVTGKRSRTADYAIAIFGVLLLTILVYFIIISTKVSSAVADDLAFNYYSAKLVMEGQNPYLTSMTPALTLYYNASKTYWLNGTVVNRYEYPAFSFLFIVPLALIFGTGSISFLYGVIIFLCLASALLVYFRAKKNPLALIPLGVWLLMAYFVVGSVIAYLAISILLVLAYFYRERTILCGILVGLAISTTQLAWFVVPFFYILLFREGGSKALFKALAVSIIIFVIINGYFVLNSPNEVSKGFNGVDAYQTIIGPTLMQLLIHPYPVPYSYALLVSAATFVFLMVLFYLYPNSLRPLMGIAPLSFFFLSWINSVGYALPILPYLLVVSYYDTRAKKVKDIDFYRKPLMGACVTLLVVFAVAMVYTHNQYVRTDTISITNVTPAVVNYTINGAEALVSLNVRVYNSGNTPAVVFFEEYTRNPHITAVVTGSLSNSTIPADSYKNFTVPCPLLYTNNNTRIFIMVYSNTSIATIRLAAS